ncbi:MAG: hypothetical protein MUD01_07760, partial [Chloroflexaceae bacterium]|nr:hypothetical protein [Chloroflexaceae bacterium]
MSINIKRKRVLIELEYWEHCASVAGRTGGTHYEAVGRCYRYLNDPRAADTFQQLADKIRVGNSKIYVDRELLLGNLYRLAGNQDAARQHYQAAYDLTMHKPTRDNGDAAILAQLRPW